MSTLDAGDENNSTLQTDLTVTKLASPMTVYPLRIKPGDDLVTALQTFVAHNNLQGAFILTCVGSLTKIKLRMANSVTIKPVPGPLEIVSLVGTLSSGGHLHGSFSDTAGNVYGGHVIGDAPVYTTAEVVIGNCDATIFTREPCSLSGYNELVVSKK